MIFRPQSDQGHISSNQIVRQEKLSSQALPSFRLPILSYPYPYPTSNNQPINPPKAGTLYGPHPLWQCAGSLQPTAPRSSERENYFKLIWILEETQMVDLHPGYMWRWPPWSCKTNLSNSSASKYFSMPSSTMPLNANWAAAILIDGQKFTTLTLEPS